MNQEPIRSIQSDLIGTQKTREAWYAIYTKSRFEKKINTALLKNGYKTFLPLIKEQRVWSDRLKTVEVPLLPGYIFIKTTEILLHHLFYYPGFVRIISERGKACIIKEEEISILRKILDNDYSVYPMAKCEVGDIVTIVRGPLKGWKGRVNETAGPYKVIFHIEGIQQFLCVEVKVSDIIKVEPVSN